MKLKLQNKNDTGVRVAISFTHNKDIDAFVFKYGGRGASQVFNFDDFTHDQVQLSEVQIPLQLSFQFKNVDYCAQVEVNYRFEETFWPAPKHMRVDKGACEL